MERVESHRSAEAPHRLFAACPIPPQEARALSEWAKSALAEHPLRILAPGSLHATIFFFGAVGSSTKIELMELTRAAQWEPLGVNVGHLTMLGRSALAVKLHAGGQAWERVRALLDLRTPHLPAGWPAERIQSWVDGHRNAADPLERMASALWPADIATSHRKLPSRHNLHATVARAKGQFSGGLANLRPPALEFVLGRFALYESFTEQAGSRYELLAESLPR